MTPKSNGLFIALFLIGCAGEESDSNPPPPPQPCDTPGAFRCVDTVLQVCGSSGWVVQENCAPGRCDGTTLSCVAEIEPRSATTFSEAFCAYAEACAPYLGAIADSEADCIETISTTEDCLPLELDNSPSEIQACIDYLNQDPCTTALARPGGWGTSPMYAGSPCGALRPIREPWDGRYAGPGQYCNGFPCVDGHFCKRTISTASCFWCESVKDIGGRCSGDIGECRSPLYCDMDTRECTAPLPDGASCDGGRCMTGYCHPDTRVCTPGVREGGTCGGGHFCAGHLRCIDGVCTELSPGGGVCNRDDDCVWGTHCLDNQCTRVATCGNGTNGELCREDGCEDGSYCDAFTSVCTAQIGLGAKCTTDAMCSGALLCSGSEYSPGECVVGAVGDSCTSAYECQAGLRCASDTSTCQPGVGLGEACTQWQDHCLEDLRCDTTSNTCQPYLAVGESCSSQFDCYSMWCSGTCTNNMSGCITPSTCPYGEERCTNNRIELCDVDGWIEIQSCDGLTCVAWGALAHCE